MSDIRPNTSDESAPGSVSASTRERLVRNIGLTHSERTLAELCDRTFLRLWSYSGIYRDQFGDDLRGQGKELCDVLVVFDQHVIIFSDKLCSFDTSIDLPIAWKRWFKKAVSKSADQLYGAERWITQHPARLFLDRNCTKPFPISLASPEKLKIHRVAVANGAAEACRQYFQSPRGTLLIDSTYQDISAHLNAPFHVGLVDRERGFVHVFDDHSLPIILRTLDTVKDLVDYLQSKEQFLMSKKVLCTGEEELLAFYLSNLDVHGKHAFVVPSDVDAVFLPEGQWEDFVSSDERIGQIKADKVSYAWDSLIERFTKHVLEGTQRSASSPYISEQEKALRWMARESRLRRRILSKALLEVIQNTPSGSRRARTIKPSHESDPYYVFVVLPKPEDTRAEEYRTARENLLTAQCLALKLKFPDAVNVVGIATENLSAEIVRSEDLACIDFSSWSHEDDQYARELQEKFGLYTQYTEHRKRFYEYPESRQSAHLQPNAKPSKNSRCICGSKKKYRKCCGKKF